MSNDTYFRFDDNDKNIHTIVKMGTIKLRTYNPVYCIKIIETVDFILDIHSTYYTRQASYIDGFVQERRNSIVNALELRLSCTKPWIYPMLSDKCA